MNCIICGGDKIKRIPLIHEVSRYTKIKYPLYRCTACGLVRPRPLPYTDENKLSIYDNPDNIKFFDNAKGEVDRESYEYKYYFKHFLPYIGFINKYDIKGKAMDVGCGAGHLMELMAKKGLVVEGMEISPVLVKAMQDKFKVYLAEVGDEKIKNKYNLVTFNHVLEHVDKPKEFLTKINHMTVKDGYIIFAVPYLSGLVPRVLRSRWYGLGYGQHLNFFSKQSIHVLLNMTGFEVCEFKVLIVDYAHPTFPRVVNICANMVSNMIVTLGMGDNLFVVACKRTEAT